MLQGLGVQDFQRVSKQAEEGRHRILTEQPSPNPPSPPIIRPPTEWLAGEGSGGERRLRPTS